MDESMTGFIVIAGLVILAINLIVARKFEDVAFKKGYDEDVHSYAMCFWLGIIGYLYVIALPDKKIGTSKNDAEYQQHL